MTIAVPVHRALSTKLASRSFNVVTRWGYNPWLARVQSTPSDEHNTSLSSLSLKSRSAYATATRTYATTTPSKPAGRPKAHTGRAPAKRSTKTSTSSKPGPKTATGKKAVGRKPKAKKVKTRAKSKPTPKKAVVKKAPSASALLKERRAKDKELKETALLDPPKLLPSTQWTVLNSEAQKETSGDFVQKAKDTAQKYKSLTPEEKEHYNHIANKNKAANITAYKNWVAQYSPQRIRDANSARLQLKKQYMEKNTKKRTITRYAPIKDERLVTRPRSNFVYFSKDRHASGDFAHMTIGESSKLIGREWKQLSATERKKFDDESKADMNRYVEEHSSVYGVAPVKVINSKSTT